MNRAKRIKIYILSWAAALIILMIMGLMNFGYEDSADITLAVMFLVVPILVMVADMAYFLRFDKYYSAVKFVFVNFLMVFGGAFILEAVVVLISFGIKHPQVKLFTFAVIFALIAAVINLLQSCFFVVVAKKK
ncbi:MAG: hypothetical protein ACI39R_01045 [Lachnospiraceae bacterium]